MSYNSARKTSQQYERRDSVTRLQEREKRAGEAGQPMRPQVGSPPLTARETRRMRAPMAET